MYQRSTEEWSLALRIAFRFAAIYLPAYFLTIGLQFSAIQPQLLASYVIVHWMGNSTYVYPTNTGSGDTLASYVYVAMLLVVAMVATTIWSVVDRHRANYSGLVPWMRLGLRYALADILIEYGFAKVFPTQFIPPSAERLRETFGNFSPMGVLWTFMGVSMPYTIFAGVTEVVSATLLIFPRTATLGALASAAVLLNVVMLNFSYDVTVKLYSLHYLLAALVLVAPDLGRLLQFLVRGQGGEALPLAGPSFTSGRMRIAGIATKTAFLVFVAWTACTSYIAYRDLPTWYKPGKDFPLILDRFQWIREYPDNH